MLLLYRALVILAISMVGAHTMDYFIPFDGNHGGALFIGGFTTAMVIAFVDDIIRG